MGKDRETDVYHYVKTLYAPTAVTDAVYCHFTSVEAKELIVATCKLLLDLFFIIADEWTCG